MFGRDKAVDPLAEAAKLLADAKRRQRPASTEFAHGMMKDEPHHVATHDHAPVAAQRKPAPPAEPIVSHVSTADPEVVQAIERMLTRLTGSASRLDARQKAALAKLPLQQQETIVKVVDLIPEGRKLAFIAIGVFIALQVLESLFGSILGRFR